MIEQPSEERACVEEVVRVWPEGGRGGEKRSRLLPSPHHLPLPRSSLGGSFPARAFKEMPVTQVKKDLGRHPATLTLRLGNSPYIFTSEAWLKKLMYDVRKTFLAGNSGSTRGRSVSRRCSLASLRAVLRVIYAGKWYDIVWLSFQAKRCLLALNLGVLVLTVPPAPYCGLHCVCFRCWLPSLSFVRMQLAC